MGPLRTPGGPGSASGASGPPAPAEAGQAPPPRRRSSRRPSAPACDAVAGLLAPGLCPSASSGARLRSNDPWREGGPRGTLPGHLFPERSQHAHVPIPPTVPRGRARPARRRRGRPRVAPGLPTRRRAGDGGAAGHPETHSRPHRARGHRGGLRLHDHVRRERHHPGRGPRGELLRHRPRLPERQQRASRGRGPEGPPPGHRPQHEGQGRHRRGSPGRARREPEAARHRPRGHLVPARKEHRRRDHRRPARGAGEGARAGQDPFRRGEHPQGTR